LSSKEREILAYLRHHNQRLFTCAADGRHAATLISRGIVHRALKQGQIFDYLDMPVEIPIEVWRFLRENVEKSPDEAPKTIRILGESIGWNERWPAVPYRSHPGIVGITFPQY